MKRNFLFGVIAVLIITNIATLLFWRTDKNVVFEDGNTEIDSREPVATIDHKKIKYEEWMNALRENYGREQLQRMIDREVVLQLAAEQDIEISEKVISREISLLTTMQGVMSEKETKAREKQWRKDILYRYQLGALLTSDVSVPEKKIREYYKDYHDQYNFKASIQLSHIVVPDRQTAGKVMNELEKGSSFELLAREYSHDDETKKDGGYLGFFVDYSKFLPDGYAKKAMKLKERSYSEPFKSGGHMAIIYLHRKLPDIKFSYEEIKPYIKRELALGKTTKNLDAKVLWNKLDIDWVYE
ncbi:peptidylprolyl isomerase [Virgibacillus siamensis]|uniref:peptidylprolyl isomerase n=1 Tax=Virgibacillus siamensis TaxID=480071 RepID=UPI0009857975|nr:peptidylprolyl isomerase [Virgibacillus siamensis]